MSASLCLHAVAHAPRLLLALRVRAAPWGDGGRRPEGRVVPPRTRTRDSQTQQAVTESSAALHRRARELLHGGRARECLRIVEDALREDAGNSYFLCLGARAHARLGNVRDCLAYAERATKASPHAVTWQLRGVLEARHGSPAVARQCFQAATEADPNCAPAWSAWARAAWEAGEGEEARRLLSRALGADPGHAQSLMLLSRMEEAAGNAEGAARAVRAVLEQRPSDRHALHRLAMLESRKGDVGAARELFGQALEGGEDAAALAAWAAMEGEGGDVGRARDLFSRAHSLNASHVPTLLGWALLEDLCGDLDRARELLRMGLAVDPRNTQLRVAMAQHLHKSRGERDEAERLLREVVRDHPRCSKAWYELGTLELGRGESAQARECFERGKGGDVPEHVLLCYEALAEAVSASGDRTGAHRVYEEGAAATKPYINARYLKAWSALEKRRGRMEEARALLTAATDLAPQDATAWLLRGVLERRLHMYAAAAQSFEKGIARQPREASLWVSYAMMQAETAGIEAARAVFRRGTGACPDSAPLWMEGGLLEARCGDVAEAREWLARACLLSPVHLPALAAWAGVEEDLGSTAAARALKALYVKIEGELAKRPGGAMGRRRGGWKLRKALERVARSVGGGWRLPESKGRGVEERGSEGGGEGPALS